MHDPAVPSRPGQTSSPGGWERGRIFVLQVPWSEGLHDPGNGLPFYLAVLSDIDRGGWHEHAIMTLTVAHTWRPASIDEPWSHREDRACRPGTGRLG